MHVVEGRVVRKLLKVGEQEVLFQVSGLKGKLEVELLSGASEVSKTVVTDYIMEWFDLGTDLKPFYALAKEDEVLKSLIERFHGYRIMGQPDLFESLIWAVLGQQINVAFAYSIKQKFVEKYGERVDFEGKTYFLFPTAERVATIDPDELLALQFSRQKSNYTIGIAQAFVSGQVSRALFQGRPLSEARDELVKIKGIGNWTANYALMRTFRYPDAFPLEDVALHKALQIQMNMRARPSLERVKKIFRKYKGWEAYATIYLWKSL